MKWLIIDGSYYNFFRYYAIMQWWGLAKKDQELGKPIENKDFVDKFRSTFVDKMHEIRKKLDLKDAILVIAKDCPRKEIWRQDLFNTYKESRDKDDTFEGGPLFKMAYDGLFTDAGASAVISHPRLEADDCAALFTREVLERYADAEVTIITSDMDYLQLAGPRTKLINLKYQDLTQSKNATGNPECDKFVKIVTGDKSDDIPGVFSKCGPKTALKMFEDRTLFESKLASEPGAAERYKLNCTLVDFDNIPDDLVESFRRNVLGK
jgi:5'-3' exonuclease